MIVGTAGHIDHGKTALVRALTGVDADRLPEEKARGITLELGFAYADVGGVERMGFVDVPGHEKLVRTMLAGATGIDCLMLVVAADDGLMPQTREHLAIADLLGLDTGLVVLTKTDKVDEDRLDYLKAEVEEALAGTSMAGAEVLAASTVTGRGVADVAEKLARLGAGAAARKAGGRFRLAIDRVFTLKGVGVVVTGTAHSGEVRVGDRVALTPGGLSARVRGLRVHDREAELGRAGERVALNLTGPRIDKDAIDRGMWAVAPGTEAATRRLDFRLTLSAAEKRPIRLWTPVHVHIGAADVLGRVSPLEGPEIAPGASGLARLFLETEVATVARDRIVLRDQSASRTIGGGRVLDPAPPERHARKPARLEILAAIDTNDHREALVALLERAPDGVDLVRFATSRNLADAEAEKLFRDAGLVRVATPRAVLGFAAAFWSALGDKVRSALAAYQEKNPESPGATVSETLRAAAPILVRPAAAVALDALVADGEVERFGALVHLRGHTAQLSLEEENLWSEVRNALAEAGLDQPRVASLAERLQVEEEELRSALSRMARLGRLRWVNKNYFVLPDVAARLAAEAESLALAHPDGLLTVGKFREETHVQRHFTMPILEFFDRVGYTARVKDGRRILRPPEGLFGAA